MRSKKCATKSEVKRAVRQHETAQHPGQPRTKVKIGREKK